MKFPVEMSHPGSKGLNFQAQDRMAYEEALSHGWTVLKKAKPAPKQAKPSSKTSGQCSIGEPPGIEEVLTQM